jgi:WD40 repeat protein
MARTRQLVAPKGTGGLLSCALSPHDGGASLAVGGENAAALVFDLRGAHLVAHRLTAAAGCFDKGDAVPCVSYNLAAPHALYCASGRVVTAWDVRRLPGAADARVRVGCVAGAAKSAPPTHPAEHGVYDDDDDDDDDAKDANDATRVWTRVSVERDQSSSISGAIDTYAHNADEINHFVIDAVGACLYAADDECEVTVVDVAKNKRLKTLRFDGHESFVSCVALRGHKPREVVSGGLDARVCVWDRDKAAAVRRWSVNELVAAADAAEAEASKKKFSQTENGEEGGANAREAARQTRQTNADRDPSRMMNPPFVHCVATWACARAPTHAHTRRLAAAACGDGTVALVDLDAPKSDASGAKKKKKKKKNTSERPGGARVDALGGLPAVFLGRGARGGAHASAASHVAFPGWGDGDVVVSGGNDRAIKAWRWNDVERRASTARHGEKVNWIAHAETREACPGGGHVFVADTSETVAVYDANAYA